ncbi:MAG: hypothetical protein LKG27_04720 [Clostridiaceae bacterium]|nr:hypothetical protein [Clostridiaceae bacterium]
MNIIVLRQLAILSLLLGGVLGIITLIPFLGTLSFIILMFCAAAIIMWFMLKVELLDISSNKESIVTGAIIGFISFIGFSIIYLPLVAILGRIFHLYMQYGISLFLGVGSFGVILMLVIFMAILCATTNAFGGFLTYYGMEFLKSIQKPELPPQQNFQQQIYPQNQTHPFNGGDNEFKL